MNVYSFASRQVSNWPYFVVTAPTCPVVELPELKLWLRLPQSQTKQDAELSAILEAVTVWGEAVANRVFRPTGFQTFRNGFSDYQDFVSGGSCPITLRRSPLEDDSSVSLTYLSDNAVIIYTDFRVIRSNQYSSIIPNDTWPTDIDCEAQAVTINFDAGYTTLPANIVHAMKMAALYLYENRGDCACSADSIPQTITALLSSNRIMPL